MLTKYAIETIDGKGKDYINSVPRRFISEQSSSLRNANLQIRSDPPVGQTETGPWNQATIEPDNMRKQFELGGSGSERTVPGYTATCPSGAASTIDESGSGIINSQTSNMFTNLLSDNYNVWVEDANGCLSNKLISEKVGEPGKIELTSIVTPSSCFGSNDGNINLIFENGVAPYSYYLSNITGIFDTGIVFQQSDSLTIENLSEGNYYFLVTDYNNCEDSISVTLNQPSEIIANFSIDEDLILEGNNVTVTNLSSGANYFSWNFGDNPNTSNEFEITYKYNKQGDFIIELIASNSDLSVICNDTVSLNIAVEGYDINNVFTPNNDGVNDEYHFGDEMLIELKVAIYNRWGQQVFAFDDVKGSWDGRGINGELLPEGVYFFTMEAVGSLGDTYIEEGTVTLLR